MSPVRSSQRCIKAEFLMFGIISITMITLLPGHYCGPEDMPGFYGFASLSAFLTVVCLKALGYFPSFRPIPRKSDLLLVLCALPAGSLAACAMIELVRPRLYCSLTELLAWTPLVSVVVFAGHMALSLLLVNYSQKKKIVLDLTVEEAASIVKEFGALKMLGTLQFLSRGQLKEYFREGREKEVSLVVISRNTVSKFDEDSIMLRAHMAGITIVDFEELSSELTGRVKLPETNLHSFVLAATPQTAILRLFSKSKRFLEPLIAAVLLVLLFPLMLALAVFIKLTSKGPILYTQRRTGYLDQEFMLYKFRSMVANAEQSGPQWAAERDSRITAIGKLLRATRLDELPQLWNVIRGDMSFFGPRPERPEIYEKLSKQIPLFWLRTIVRPGITGWAQVCSGYAASIEESRLKLEYDLFYIKHMSPRLDLIILIKTFLVAILGSERTRTYRPDRRNTGSGVQRGSSVAQAGA